MDEISRRIAALFPATFGIAGNPGTYRINVAASFNSDHSGPQLVVQKDCGPLDGWLDYSRDSATEVWRLARWKGKPRFTCHACETTLDFHEAVIKGEKLCYFCSDEVYDD